MSAFNLNAFKDIFESSSDPRDDIVSMARAAENAERYEDMCQFMRYLVETIAIGKKEVLTVEERNLLSVAYKNVIGTRRASWRTLAAEVVQGEVKDQELAKQYGKIVEAELKETCDEVTSLLNELIPMAANDTEASVFYLKMAGDYYRYLAESVSSDDSYPQKAAKYYDEAYEIATKGSGALVPTHPIRLGLALNYSVCHYEILKDKANACDLAKKAFDDAIAQLDKLEESDYKDSTLIMQLLRDNLTLWSAAEGDGEGVQVEDFSDEEN